MEFRLKTDLYYDVYAPSTFVFSIHALKNTSNQKIISESIEISPDLAYKEFYSQNSNIRFITLKTNEFVPFRISYEATIEVQHKTIHKNALLKNTPIFDLKNNIIPFLYPSRHCPSDKLIKLAFNLFGHLQTDFEKVVAVNDWIYNNIDYVPGSTDSNTTAYNTIIQREGVCKDFAHLGIALCRALNIPARYFTCYAGNLYPPDIHACFEAYLGNKWILFDPTRLSSLDSIVKIAHGKDGSEIAVANIFGNAFCTYMNIECERLNNDSEPHTPSEDFFILY